jgi:hypothetical protein
MTAWDLSLHYALREPIADAARFSTLRIVRGDFSWNIPNRVRRLHRPNRLSLGTYLENHADHPTGGDERNLLHDGIRDWLWAYPEALGLTSRMKSYREVELLLRSENQARLHLLGEEREHPLTVVDNVFYDAAYDRLVLAGVISCDFPGLRQKETKPLNRATRYFFHNWGPKAERYLIIGPDIPPKIEPLPPLHMRTYRGVFS